MQRQPFAIIIQPFYWKWKRFYPLIDLIFVVAFGTSEDYSKKQNITNIFFKGEYNLNMGTELMTNFYVIKWVIPTTMHTSSTIS